MVNHDWGVQFELDAAAITTTYQVVAPSSGAAAFAGRVPRRRYTVLASLINATNITGIKAKLSASADGVTYHDVASTDDATGTLQIEQTYSSIVSHAINGSFYIDGGFPYLQLSLKATGAAGQALETLKVSQLDATVVGSGVATLLGAETLANKTLTAPVIAGGLSASGSTANDFSSSTGAFKTSSGLNTLGGDALMASGKILGFGAEQSISAAGATAANVTTRTTRALGGTAGNNITSSLADGTQLGQRKTLVLATITAGKTWVISPTHFADGTTITLAHALDGVELEWQTSGWRVVGQLGSLLIA